MVRHFDIHLSWMCQILQEIKDKRYPTINVKNENIALINSVKKIINEIR